MKHVTVSTLKEVVQAEGANSSIDFINVCTPAEYKEKHIPGVRNVPLDKIDSHLSEFAGKNTIYVHCRSGRRGVQAIDKLRELGVTAELVNVEGGLLAWEEAGFETRSHTSRMPIIRQTMTSAGALILLGVLLSQVLDATWIYLAGAVGAGLLFAVLTGRCGMAIVLARMPWNR